jgi:hypothetical protein
MVLGTETRTFPKINMCSTTQPHPQLDTTSQASDLKLKSFIMPKVRVGETGTLYRILANIQIGSITLESNLA